MELNNQQNLAREIPRFNEAIEGELYYNNALATGPFRDKYFGHLFEIDDPVISVPLTSAFIDRIMSILRANIMISSSDTEINDALPNYLELFNYHDIIKTTQLKALATGNQSVWLSKSIGTDTSAPSIKLTNWESYYTAKLDNDGYIKSYILNKGVMEPALYNDKRRLRGKDKVSVLEQVNDTYWLKWVDDDVVFNYEHGFGFTPVVWFNSIDVNKEGYGVPYVNRFKTLLNNLNYIYSESMRSLLLLQNIWITNKSFQDPEKPISLNPRNIQFVGPDGTLEQSIKNLNLSEEWNMMKALKGEIQKAAQMPSDIFLEGLGKVESGIALRLAYTPLFELISSVISTFKEREESLVYKAIKAQRMLDKKADKEFDITVDYNTEILPIDKDAQFDFDLKRLQAGAISQEYFNNKYGEESDI